MKKVYIRGNKEKVDNELLRYMKMEGWEDAHRFASSDLIIKGLMGRIGDTYYWINM